MLERMACGDMPPKHHIKNRGRPLYEECLTREGFEGPYTIMYHLGRPQAQHVAQTRHGFVLPQAGAKKPLAKRHYRAQDLARSGGAMVNARIPFLFNDDVVISMAQPDCSDPVYFVNADADDLYYIASGSGVLRSPLGDVPFNAQDYLFVPKGLLSRFIFSADQKNGPVTILCLECLGGVKLLPQWRNETGQLRMDAPYCHRDFRRPTFVGPMDEQIRQVLVKKDNSFHAFSYDASPVDIVGWDGTVYPWAFPILNFQPRAGLVHLPPTWHGTFATRNALICSFVPRVVDFHPDAIPCPYPHTSVDCDEFLYYCKGNFTSRRGVAPGSMSFHPAGVPHGPHPGAYEASMGTTRTEELAVMLDTYKPLQPTTAAAQVEDAGYQESFC